MTQYQTPYDQPFDDAMTQRPRTSGLAITALVFSLIGILPCCGIIFAPIGAVLGLIGAITIGGKPGVKGRGMAVTSIILGLLFTIGWAIGGAVIWKNWVVPVMIGPNDALASGFRGDRAGLRAAFHGPGASASDAEVDAFIDALRQSFGEYQSCEFAGDPNKPDPQGRPRKIFMYRLHFSNATAMADAEMVFADPPQPGFVFKWGSITVHDPQQGDIVYPPSP